jgi:hypothetical protein
MRTWGRLGAVVALAVSCGGQTEGMAGLGVGGALGANASGGVGNAARQTEVGGSGAGTGVGGLGGAVGSGGIASATGGSTGTGGLGAVVEQVVELCPGIYLEQVDGPPVDVNQLGGLDVTLVDQSSTIESMHHSASSGPIPWDSTEEAGVKFSYGCEGRLVPDVIEVGSGGDSAAVGFFRVSIDRNCVIAGTYVDSQGASHVIDGGAGTMRLQYVATSVTPLDLDLITGTLYLAVNDGQLVVAQFELYLARAALRCD